MEAITRVIIQLLFLEFVHLLILHHFRRYAKVLVIVVKLGVIVLQNGLLIKLVKASLMLRHMLLDHKITSQLFGDILTAIDAVEFLLLFVYVGLECYLAYSSEYLLSQTFVELQFVLRLQIGQILLLVRQNVLVFLVLRAGDAICSEKFLAFSCVNGLVHPSL